MGRREIRSLKTRMGQECSIRRQIARLYNKCIHLGRTRVGSQSREEAPRVRAVKSSEFGKGKL